MLTFLAASIVAAGQTFTCTPTHVWDGDGPIWCAEGPHVRLSGIAARFSVTEDAILDANDLTEPDRIFVGQELIVPAAQP